MARKTRSKVKYRALGNSVDFTCAVIVHKEKYHHKAHCSARGGKKN